MCVLTKGVGALIRSPAFDGNRSMLRAGIVGLPNVGKSTLFNALTAQQSALAANYPFATIEPNVGVVPVPDERLEPLAKIVKTTTIVLTILASGSKRSSGTGTTPTFGSMVANG